MSTHSLRIQKLCMIFIILLNINTLWYVTPFSQNLSHLGNELGHKFYLFLWAFSAAAYFYYYTKKVMVSTSYQHKLVYWILRIACIFMVISVMLPYAPTQYPELSKWHTRLAMLSTVAYALCYFHYTSDLLLKNHPLFEKIFTPYLLLIVFQLLLYLLVGGVSTMLEIIFTIAMSYYLYHITVLIMKNDNTILKEL